MLGAAGYDRVCDALITLVTSNLHLAQPLNFHTYQTKPQTTTLPLIIIIM